MYHNPADKQLTGVFVTTVRPYLLAVQTRVSTGPVPRNQQTKQILS